MNADGSSEHSVADMYCVVYRLKGQEWVACGKGWSQIHLYKDLDDGTHRVVGWTVSDYDVIVNANITAKCSYKRKSSDFHKLATETKQVYGFGFYKKEASLEEAEAFLAEVNKAIGEDRKRAERPPARVRQSTAFEVHHKSATNTVRDESKMLHKIKDRSLDSLWDEELRAFKMGTLRILPPLPNKRQSGVPAGTRPISAPTVPSRTGRRKKSKASKPKVPVSVSDVQKVQHTVHVKFDKQTRKYTGVPKDWQVKLQKQFGLPPSAVECVAVEGYVRRIPLVLIAMKKYLFENGGLESEGIFRIAPDQGECLEVKQLLEIGDFERCKDINAIANLIKVWFRELPDRIMAGVPHKLIRECKTEADAAGILKKFPEPNQSILLWLLDTLAEVSTWQRVNKMSPKNLAIVMAPNLFSADNLDPMAGLVFSQKVALFLYKAILARLATQKEKSKSSGGLQSVDLNEAKQRAAVVGRQAAARGSRA